MIISLLTRLLFAAYFLEAGFILCVAPWTSLWTRNLFVDGLPALAPLLGSSFVRGGVSGIGAITVMAGIVEIVAAIASRRLRGHAAPSAPPLPRPERENS